MVKQQDNHTLKNLKRKYVKGSLTTVWVNVRELRYSRMNKVKEIELTDEDRKRRVEWCYRNLERDWSHVIFSDKVGIDN